MDSNVQKVKKCLEDGTIINNSEVIFEFKSPKITMEFLNDRPLSKSSLVHFRKSPKHYIQYLTEPKKDETFYALGNAVETLILQPENFSSKFQIYQKFDKRSDAAKEKWRLMLEEANANNVTLLEQEDNSKANIIANSIKNNPQTSYYLDKIALNKIGEKRIQEKVFWIDKKTGLPIIGYVDFVCDIDGHLIIVDLKTTNNGDPDTFMKQAANFEYELQVGCYLTGFHKMRFQFPDFMFMVAETEMPFNCQMHYCPPNYCEDAKNEFSQTLTAFKYCMDNNLWHQGYEFWLFDTLPYFMMEKPKYKKSKFVNEK